MTEIYFMRHAQSDASVRNFEEMENKLPWAVKMTFDSLTCLGIEKHDI